jgi:hypothetical protein
LTVIAVFRSAVVTVVAGGSTTSRLHRVVTVRVCERTAALSVWC